MRDRMRLAGSVALPLLAIAWMTSAQQNLFLGRWTLTSLSEPPAYVGWLETAAHHIAETGDLQ
jgi:hypothetical protein